MNTFLLKMFSGVMFISAALAQTVGPTEALKPEVATLEAPIIEEVPYKPQIDEKDPYSLVNYFSKKYNVDVNLAFKIAKCESNWDIKAKNPSSTAYSIFQVLDGTLKHINERSKLGFIRGILRDEVEAAIWLLKNEGVSHWKSSKSCWSNDTLSNL